jgi:hypothetical protein
VDSDRTNVVTKHTSVSDAQNVSIAPTEDQLASVSNHVQVLTKPLTTLSTSGSAHNAADQTTRSVSTNHSSSSPPTSFAAPIPNENLPTPINLSDVIAQTDIELRRLGWSTEEGREFLEQTYSKRSRHELSEEELIQFLCHLESLPPSEKKI